MYVLSMVLSSALSFTYQQLSMYRILHCSTCKWNIYSLFWRRNLLLWSMFECRLYSYQCKPYYTRESAGFRNFCRRNS